MQTQDMSVPYSAAALVIVALGLLFLLAFFFHGNVHF